MKKGIAIYGGSFNPPANSHISIAKQIIEKINFIEKIVFLPVNIEYEKNELISNEHRYNMLQLICNNNSKFEISSYEMNNKQKNYTIDSLNALKQIYQSELYFVIGTDNLKNIQTWKEVDSLLKNFKILVVEREDDCFETIIENNKFLSKYKNSFIKANNVKTAYVSSSVIRESIKLNEDVSQYLPYGIEEYIKKHKLYI